MLKPHSQFKYYLNRSHTCIKSFIACFHLKSKFLISIANRFQIEPPKMKIKTQEIKKDLLKSLKLNKRDTSNADQIESSSDEDNESLDSDQEVITLVFLKHNLQIS
jgi:hypothetical protein